MIIVWLILSLFTSLCLSVLPDPNPSKIDRPILKISTRTHDKIIIINNLQEIANNISVGMTSYEKFNWLSSNEMRECVEGSCIKFYIREIKCTDRTFIASECRTNLNARFQSILQPTTNIHNLILRDEDSLDTQLKTNLVDHFSSFRQFKEFKFNDFNNNLNYDLQCLVDYQLLMQVHFKQTVVEVNLMGTTEVADACQFDKINPNFDGLRLVYTTTYLPVNGTFYCQKGKSQTCNRTIAESKNSRYKLPDICG